MAHYILQVIFFQLGFLLVYEILLKNETFFNYNRIYLLFAPVIAFVLPFLNFSTLGNVIPAEKLVMLPEVVIGETTETNNAVQITFNWWLIIYASGVVFCTFLFLKKYSVLRKLFRFKIISAEKNLKIIEIPQSKIACTFYNTIFLGDQISESEKQQILSHELVHVRQKHSLDLLFFEVQKIIFWFNPLVYLYQSRLASLHEYIADAQVVKTTEKKAYYQQMLNTAFSTENISFINQFFNHSLIKKRIVMLQKQKSRSIAKFKYLLIVPLMLCMLTYVACSNEKDELNTSPTEKVEDGILVIEVKDVQNQTGEEMKRIEEATKNMSAKGYHTVRVTDGRITMETTMTPPTPPAPPAPGIPFTVIDKVPTFPGCEGLTSNEERKTCMSKKVQDYVMVNFNKKSIMPVANEGENRIYAQFMIDEKGNVVDVKARASNPELQEEAERVIKGLPQMEPGEHKGAPASVMYSLPIVFQK